MSCPRALKNVTRTAGNWTTNLLIRRTAPPLSYSHPHRIHTWQLCEQICYCSSSIIVFFIHMCMSFLGLDYELFSKAVVLCIYCSLLFWSGYVVHYEGWSCGCAYGYCSIAPFVVQDVDTLWKTLAMKELLSRISKHVAFVRYTVWPWWKTYFMTHQRWKQTNMVLSVKNIKRNINWLKSRYSCNQVKHLWAEDRPGPCCWTISDRSCWWMKRTRPPAANSRRNQREQGSLLLRPRRESTTIFHFIPSMMRHSQNLM